MPDYIIIRNNQSTVAAVTTVTKKGIIYFWLKFTLVFNYWSGNSHIKRQQKTYTGALALQAATFQSVIDEEVALKKKYMICEDKPPRWEFLCLGDEPQAGRWRTHANMWY